MKARALLATILLLPILAACSSSSGVVRTGIDSYMVAASHKGFSGQSGTVLASAMAQADAYCEQRGLVLKVIRTEQKDMVPFKSDAQAVVYFMALKPDDPRLKENGK